MADISNSNLAINENSLTLIETGEDRLCYLIDLIDGAQINLCLYYYIFSDDESGQLVMNRLLSALSRGVRVSLMIDTFGSNDTPSSFWGPFKQAGGIFGAFSPKWGQRYLIRNHQKILIADNEKLLMGGFNIADQYLKSSGEDAWHDLGLLISGPAVLPMVDYYEKLAAWILSPKPRWNELRRLVRKGRTGDAGFQWLLGGPVGRLSPWARSVKLDLDRANQLDMVSAYFSPSQSLLRRMGKIPSRGSMRLILPSKSDNGATIGAARILYAYLLKRGVKIHEYQPSKLHMKLLIIDDIVYIGSANFDMRSLFINVEIMLRIDDPRFASEMRALFRRQILQCNEITIASHKAKASLFKRLRWSLSYFLVAVLDYTITRRINIGLNSDDA